MIRDARAKDVPAILRIYNEAVAHTTATFDTEPRTLPQWRKWYREHGPRYPVLVVVRDKRVIGWGAMSRYSDRQAYERTAEISLYLEPQARGRGFGKALLENVILAGRRAGLHAVLARITAGNEVSLKLHRDAGFDDVGVLREVGTKFGRLLDVHLLQLLYPGT